MKSAKITSREVAGLLGQPAPANTVAGEAILDRLANLETATPSSIIFAVDEDALNSALISSAGLILSQQVSASGDPRVLVVPDARKAFARIYREWFDTRGSQGIHPSAVIDPSAIVGPGCQIGAGTVIESNVELGPNCTIGPRVTIHSGTTLGARVRVQSGAVLGSNGFGYVREPEGYFGFPQIGTVVIADDVEIGANTTIDRGALGATRIGRGTKIDNLVHIAHNCSIGEHVIIAAQVGMAGSTTIENNVMLGGQVGLGERVTIAEGVVLGGQGGVLPGKTLAGKGEIFWGTPARPVRDYLRDLARMRKR